MMHTPAPDSTKIKKHHIALALAVLAALSYVFSMHLDSTQTHAETGVAGIMTALAKDDASGYEMFLKLDAIQGDSDDSKHRNEVSVDSYAWSETRAGTKQGLGGFTVTMPVSRASAKMFLYGASGTHITRIVLSVRKNGSQDFLKWTLTDAQVAAFQTVGNTHGDGVMDQVTFSFGKLEVEYHQLLPDGTLGPASTAGWDLRTGKSA